MMPPTAAPEQPWWWWLEWRLVLRAAFLSMLTGHLVHLWRWHWEGAAPITNRLHRLCLLAWWRREVRALLRGWEAAWQREWSAQAPSVAELRKHTADLVPYAVRRNGTPRPGRSLPR